MALFTAAATTTPLTVSQRIIGDAWLTLRGDAPRRLAVCGGDLALTIHVGSMDADGAQLSRLPCKWSGLLLEASSDVPLFVHAVGHATLHTPQLHAAHNCTSFGLASLMVEDAK